MNRYVTVIPIVIAAIVIVIISKGIDKWPTIPNINDDKILGSIPIMLNLTDLNKIINMKK